MNSIKEAIKKGLADQVEQKRQTQEREKRRQDEVVRRRQERVKMWYGNIFTNREHIYRLIAEAVAQGQTELVIDRGSFLSPCSELAEAFNKFEGLNAYFKAGEQNSVSTEGGSGIHVPAWDKVFVRWDAVEID